MTDKFSKDNIETEIFRVLSENFEIPLEELSLTSNMYTDLDLDSIDAVDLVIELQEFTDKKVNPEVFKELRTIEDVVIAVYQLVNEA